MVNFKVTARHCIPVADDSHRFVLSRTGQNIFSLLLFHQHKSPKGLDENKGVERIGTIYPDFYCLKNLIRWMVTYST